MPFVDVVGNVGATSPEQIGATAAKVGVTLGLTVTVNVVVDAHWPASGVKVYVAVAVLLTTAGFHVPVMPFSDVNGNTGAIAPEQIGATAVKVGVTIGVIVISKVVVAVAH
jgi:aminoglycoside/choline kinase family phosphotransferase